MNNNENKIPTGKVTFLFTDIEGSTKLAQEFPDTLQAALEIHHGIMQKAIDANNGFIFEIVGDAFCCAFENSEDAVKAAVDAQLKLSEEKWKDAVIKIRIGIHSGNAEWNGKRYMGYITLARTSRVMSAAYGEQIIISNDVYENIRKKMYDTNEIIRNRADESEISFRDLGERRLKDVNQPVRLFQILNKGLREEFPPLMTLDARPNNLPVQLTNFIGREEEIKQVKELFKSTHLLTLTGSGGAGKTRFALQTGADIIDDFANGVWFVELAAVSNAFLLPQSFLNILSLKEEPGKTPEQTLIEHLKDKDILLILDNCEHLIKACSEISEKLLSSCPKLKILATSREALNCSGEQTYRIPPLTIPDPDKKDTTEQLTQYESVRLFIERALAVNPNFRVTNENAPALAAICSQLDGIPLAIELAAARTKILSVEKIFERLDDRFNLLTGGKRTALPRQQTLRALIDWSYDLLSDEEKILWSRLSVFTSGWTLEAAEEVCSDETINKYEILDLLCQFTEKSIIIYNEDKERYNILETIKQYGKEKLLENNEIYFQHVKYFLDLSEQSEHELNGKNAKLWLDIFETDHNNFQSAIDWCLEKGEAENAARISASLGQFWNIRGYNFTGRRLLDVILIHAEKISKKVLGKIFLYNGILTLNLGKYKEAQKLFEKCLILSGETGEKRGIAFSLNNLGNIENDLGNYENARKYFSESLEIGREIGDKISIADALRNLGILSDNKGEYEKALNFLEESLKIRREIGNISGIANSLNGLGIAEFRQGNFEKTEKLFEESLEIRREIGDKHGLASGLNDYGYLTYYMGNFEKARKFFEESLSIQRELGGKRGISYLLINFGNVEISLGNYEAAQKFLEECLEIRREIRDKRGISDALDDLALVTNCLENYEKAWKFYEESLLLRLEIGESCAIAKTLIGFASLIFKRKKLSNTIILLGAVDTVFKSEGSVLEINEKKLQEKIIKELHEKFSEEEFTKYFEEGKKLKIEEAADLILNDKL